MGIRISLSETANCIGTMWKRHRVDIVPMAIDKHDDAWLINQLALLRKQYERNGPAVILVDHSLTRAIQHTLQPIKLCEFGQYIVQGRPHVHNDRLA